MEISFAKLLNVKPNSISPMENKPIPAKIIFNLKDASNKGEEFIGLSGSLYNARLIYESPRVLRIDGNTLELTVTFYDHNSFENWQKHSMFKKYWESKFLTLLNRKPETVVQNDVLLENVEVKLCVCEKSNYYFLQGRTFGIFDSELTCANCLGQVPYSLIPNEIGIDSWQRQHGRIFMNYFESSFLEKSSLSMLTNYKNGKLAIEGQVIREKLSLFLKKPVYYHYFILDEDSNTVCPVCKGNGTKTGLGRPSRICKKCKSAFGISK